MGKVLLRDWLRTQSDLGRLNAERNVRKGEFSLDEAIAMVAARTGHPAGTKGGWKGFNHEVGELSGKKVHPRTIRRHLDRFQDLADAAEPEQPVAAPWVRLFDAVAAFAEETGKPGFWALVSQFEKDEHITRGIHWSGTRASFLRGAVWERSHRPTRFTLIDPAFWALVNAARKGDVERDPADHAVAVVVDPYAQIQRLERYTQIQVLKAPRDRAGDRLPASGV